MKVIVTYTIITDLEMSPPERTMLCLPKALQDEISSYKMNDDRLRLLAGKRLLQMALAQSNHDQTLIHSYKIADNGKPYIPRFYPFNISHSGHVVTCAVLLTEGEIGIDCEKVRPIQPSSFTKQFSPSEMNWILSSENPQRRFFDAWTMKEAVMKADGRGMRIPLHNIRLNQDHAVIDDRSEIWYLYPLYLHPEHPAHLCSNRAITDIQTIQIAPEALWLI